MTEEVGFLLVPRFSALAFLCAVEPLRVANRLAGRPLYRWRVFSETGEAVAASNEMRTLADAPFRPDILVDSLVVCAGFEPLRGTARTVITTLKRLAARGIALGALDTGVFLLARAGLVGSAPVTLHWEAEPAFREAFPDLAVSSELFSNQSRLFTCAGGTASLDLMLDRIGRAHGSALARAISEQFIHDRIRLPNDDQRMTASLRLGLGPAGRLVARAASYLERDLERPFDRNALAVHLGVTPRQVERLFARHLRQGPAAWHRTQRLNRARSLLRETDLPLVEIASACGFASRSDFSRCYSAVFGIAPGRDRIAGRVA